MQLKRLNIADLSADPANARKHSERNIESIMASLRRFGQQKPIVVDKSGVVRAGNGTLEAAKRLGWTEIDAAMSELTGSEMTAYAIADNRTAELAEWDDEILAATLEGLQFEDKDLFEVSGFNDTDLADLMKDIELDDEQSGGGSGEGDPEDDTYTAKIIAPIYEPKGERPAIADLFDRKKTAELIAGIKAAKLPKETTDFLILAAERHTAFHFRNIAEFYCHASPEVQDLMERSGLVIIDFKKAIECGFVHMTEQLGKIADLEESDNSDVA